MAKRTGMDRRGFIKASAIGLAGVGTTLWAGAAPAAKPSGEEPPKILSYRTLGRTGFKASDIGIGTSQAYSPVVMGAALDAGVNYIDTAEGYGRGASEQSIGEAIRDRGRSSLFITTKIRVMDNMTKDQVIEKFAMEKYAGLGSQAAEACQTCPGFCEKACPYGVSARGLLVLAHAQMSLRPWA